MKHTYHFLSMFLLLVFCGHSYGQNYTVTGTVKIASGETIAGASIKIVGASTSASTNAEGRFTLQVEPNATLEVSYLGFLTQKVAVNNQKEVSITLTQNESSLEEVVIVGYGAQKKENLTGSVAAISGKALENRSLTNVSSALAGQAAGVFVRQGSGRPGSDGATIRIRGTGTLNNADALVVVDGIIGVMDAVNPNDIESISVLKDAASAAIYGAQAANGVILITTKKGRNTQPQINYTGIVSMTQPSNMPEFVADYVRHMELYNEGATNIGQAAPYQQSTIDLWKEKNKDPNALNEFGYPNYVAYPNTNWGKEIFENNLIQNHNISVLGGAERVSYNISSRFMNNPGIMANTGFKRYETRANIETKVKDFLVLGTQTFASIENREKGNVDNLFNFLRQSTPGVYPFYAGKYGGAAAPDEAPILNNLQTYLDGTSGKDQRTRINSTLYGRLNFMKGLTLESKVNYQMRMQEETSYTNPISRWNFNTNSIVAEGLIPSTLPTAQGYNKNYTLTFDNVLRYSAEVNKHQFGALVGHNEYYYNYYDFDATKRGLIDASINNIGSGTEMVGISGTEYDRSMRSFFGRVNYNYANKYLVEVNVRRDASSRFGSDFQWGTFPSFSAAWRLSEEPFMQGVNRYIQNLKIRASWGKLGNDAAGNYDWQATYGPVNYSFGGAQTAALRQSKIANPQLKWETSTVSGIATEFNLFKNKATVEIEYYNRHTSDILTVLPIPLTNGTISAATVNAGAVLNRGVEVNFGWKDQRGDFSYGFAGNFAYNFNQVTKFKGKLTEGWQTVNNAEVYQSNIGDVSSGDLNRILEGYGINEYYLRSVYKGDGSYQHSDGSVNILGGPESGMIRTQADMEWVEAMKTAGYSFSPVNNLGKAQLYYGDLIFADLNGDKIYGNNFDRRFTGTRSEPKYTVGFSANMAFKGIDLSMVWSGGFGMQYYWNAEGYNNSIVRNGNGIATRIADDHYYYNDADPMDSKNSVNGQFPRLKYNGDNINNALSDFWLYNASYIKLRNIQVGYTLPKTWLNNLKLQNARIYFTGENLFTITKFPGLDPEIGAGVGYPTMRQYALGLTIGF